MKKNAAIAVVLGTVALSGEAMAYRFGEFTIRGNEQILIQRGEESEPNKEDQEKEVLESRLSLELSWQNFIAGGRFDYLDPYFYEKDDPPNGLRPIEYTGLRKWFVEYEDGVNHARVGSFGALFGRGMALNLFEDARVNVDRELEGLLLERRTGDYRISIVGGWGSYLEFDPPSNYKRDRVMAGFATRRFRSSHEIGAGYVESRAGDPGEDDLINRKFLCTYRLDLNQASVYGEVVQSRPVEPDGSTPEDGPGYGGYLELDGWFGNFTWRGGYKNYNLKENGPTSEGVHWSEPPSLRPINDLTTLNRKQFSINKNNEVGFNLEATWDPDFDASFALFYVKTSDREFIDITPDGPEDRVLWSPVWAGVSGVEGSLTNLFEELTGKVDAHPRENWSSHLVVDYTVDGHLGSLKKQHTLGWINELEIGEANGVVLALEYQRTDDRKYAGVLKREDPDAEPPIFHDGIATLTYSRSPWFATFISYERTNEADHWEAVGYKLAPEALEDSYLIAGFDLDVTQNTRLGLQFGRERGGVVCRGGTCQFLQPFKGWRMEFLHRF